VPGLLKATATWKHEGAEGLVQWIFNSMAGTSARRYPSIPPTFKLRQITLSRKAFVHENNPPIFCWLV
jgi:hypothetical protein